MKKQMDFAVIILILLLSSVVWFVFDLKPLIGGGLLFMLLPVAYLGIREAKPWKALIGASFILGFLLGFFFDFIQMYNQAWSVDRLAIPWKILDVMPIDNAIGYFLMTLFTLVFYEHFFTRRRDVLLPRRFYKVAVIVTAVVTIMLVIAVVDITLLTIPYPYIVGGLAAATLTIVAALRRQKLLGSLTSMSVFFFFVWLLAEIVAVVTGGWTYPGTQYLGWVSIGEIHFPIEELLFWMVWYAPFLVLGYEHLIRNKKTLPESAPQVPVEG